MRTVDAGSGPTRRDHVNDLAEEMVGRLCSVTPPTHMTPNFQSREVWLDLQLLAINLATLHLKIFPYSFVGQERYLQFTGILQNPDHRALLTFHAHC